MKASEIAEGLQEWVVRNEQDIDVTVEDENGTFDSEILQLSTYEAGRPVFIVKTPDYEPVSPPRKVRTMKSRDLILLSIPCWVVAFLCWLAAIWGEQHYQWGATAFLVTLLAIWASASAEEKAKKEKREREV